METNTRSARGCSARFSLVGGVRGFLTALGVAGMLVTPAFAQQPNTRAASLLPPKPLDPGETPPLARGAIDDSIAPVITPVIKPGPRTLTAGTTGPAWLNGVDPNVTPVSGIAPRTPTTTTIVNQPTPAPVIPPRPTQPVVRDDQPKPVTGADKLKGTPGERKPTADQNATTEPPNANTPIRGTGPNGAPVYAGPPAYRWYGYGSVTPGANPFAPTGQYPKASASWYNVTGATPGAFPVPVMNPLRPPAGVDPPAYAMTPAYRSPSPLPMNPPPVVNNNAVAPPQIPAGQPAGPWPVATPTASDTKFERNPPAATAEPPRMSPPPRLEAPVVGPAPTTPVTTPFRPEPIAGPMPPAAPTTVPTLTPPPMIGPAIPPLPQPQPLPVAPPEPVEVKPVAPPVSVVPSIGPSDPLVPQLPLPSAVAPAVPNRTMPNQPSGTSHDINWQPTGETPAPPEGTWSPAIGTPQNPRGAGMMNRTSQLVARGQSADPGQPADPIGDVIRAVCRGRATGVELRWTGTKRLTVCFEVPSQADAAKLVKDISARPELTPLQIDFCVLVK